MMRSQNSFHGLFGRMMQQKRGLFSSSSSSKEEADGGAARWIRCGFRQALPPAEGQLHRVANVGQPERKMVACVP